MSNISTTIIIISILVIIVIVFIIYLITERNFKKAAVACLLLILTVVLGLLADEAVKRVDNEPENPGTVIGENAIDNTNYNNDDSKSKDDEISSNTNIKGAGDFLYSISPLSRTIVKNRNKKYSPDWLLITMSSLGSMFFIVLAVLTGIAYESIGKTLFNVTVALVLSFIFFYIVFGLASVCIISGVGIWPIIVAVLVYFFIICIAIGLLLLEMEIIDF